MTGKIDKFWYEAKRYGLLYQLMHIGQKIHIVSLQKLNDYKNDKATQYFKELDPKQYPLELREWLDACVPNGRKYDIEHPVTFNEKIQWLKLHDNLPIKTTLSDKLLVRDWVTEKIGEKYLVPLVEGGDIRQCRRYRLCKTSGQFCA